MELISREFVNIASTSANHNVGSFEKDRRCPDMRTEMKRSEEMGVALFFVGVGVSCFLAQ